jgi:adenosylhomocysteinase
VAVVEPDEIRALEAAMQGFAVLPAEEAVPWADLVVTATGRPGVLAGPLLDLLPDGVVLANVGHFDWEIDVAALRARGVGREEPDEAIERLDLGEGRHVVLLSGGRMINLTGRAPKGNSVESMDLGFALQARSLAAVAARDGSLVPGAQPVPDAIDRDLAARLVRRLRPPVHRAPSA